MSEKFDKMHGREVSMLDLVEEKRAIEGKLFAAHAKISELEAMLKRGNLYQGELFEMKAQLTQAQADAKALFEQTRERCAKVCESNNLVSGSIGPLMNVGWANCQQACADAIRALAPTESAPACGGQPAYETHSQECPAVEHMRVADPERATELLPCPFCGGNARICPDDSYGGCDIGCTTADCEVGFGDEKDKLDALIKQWNRRAEQAESADRGEAVNLARNLIESDIPAPTPKGIRMLCEAVLAMDQAMIAASQRGEK